MKLGFIFLALTLCGYSFVLAQSYRPVDAAAADPMLVPPFRTTAAARRAMYYEVDEPSPFDPYLLSQQRMSMGMEMPESDVDRDEWDVVDVADEPFNEERDMQMWMQQTPQQPQQPRMPTLAEIDAELKNAFKYRDFLAQLKIQIQQGKAPAPPQGQRLPTMAEVEQEEQQLAQYIAFLQQMKQQVQGQQPQQPQQPQQQQQQPQQQPQQPQQFQQRQQMQQRQQQQPSASPIFVQSIERDDETKRKSRDVNSEEKTENAIVRAEFQTMQLQYPLKSPDPTQLAAYMAIESAPSYAVPVTRSMATALATAVPATDPNNPQLPILAAALVPVNPALSMTVASTPQGAGVGKPVLQLLNPEQMAAKHAIALQIILNEPLELVDALAVGEIPHEGQAHFHCDLDGGVEVASVAPRFDFHHIPSGTHTVSCYVADNAHLRISDKMSMTVNIP